MAVGAAGAVGAGIVGEGCAEGNGVTVEVMDAVKEQEEKKNENAANKTNSWRFFILSLSTKNGSTIQIHYTMPAAARCNPRRGLQKSQPVKTDWPNEHNPPAARAGLAVEDSLAHAAFLDQPRDNGFPADSHKMDAAHPGQGFDLLDQL